MSMIPLRRVAWWKTGLFFTENSCRLDPRWGAGCLENQRGEPDGGARRDRTDDLMLAKHALSQLSYGPNPWIEPWLETKVQN